MMLLNKLYGNLIKHIDLHILHIEHGLYHNKIIISKHKF